jgi:hypothetical protein
VLALLGAIGYAASAYAEPRELDAWCAQAKRPLSIALCSDPELRELAIQRNRAFEVAGAKLSTRDYKKLCRYRPDS